MVLIQKWPFFQFFLLGNIGQKNVFYDILKRINPFLACKNKNFKKSKNWHLSKGVTHGFGPKMAIFQLFFLGNIGQENVFYDILAWKNAFLGHKKKKFKKLKNWHFFNGVNPWLCSKNGHFSKFFFGKYRNGKCLLRYSRVENSFLGYKNTKFKKWKNWHFFKGVNPWFWSKNGHVFNFFFSEI